MNPLPALKDAAYDRHLSGTDKAIYLLLLYELDLQQYREIKQEFVAASLDLNQSTVSKSLAQLVATGYIERLLLQQSDLTKVYRHRLVYRRVAPEPPATASAA